MPQLLRVGPYTIYFWSNETFPLEPIHVHIVEGQPTRDATKIWITSTGRALLCHNKSRIPDRVLNRLLRVVEANKDEFVRAWLDHFGQVRYYCYTNLNLNLSQVASGFFVMTRRRFAGLLAASQEPTTQSWRKRRRKMVKV